jgi:hypothetical protein
MSQAIFVSCSTHGRAAARNDAAGGNGDLAEHGYAVSRGLPPMDEALRLMRRSRPPCLVADVPWLEGIETDLGSSRAMRSGFPGIAIVVSRGSERDCAARLQLLREGRHCASCCKAVPDGGAGRADWFGFSQAGWRKPRARSGNQSSGNPGYPGSSLEEIERTRRPS